MFQNKPLSKFVGIMLMLFISINLSSLNAQTNELQSGNCTSLTRIEVTDSINLTITSLICPNSTVLPDKIVMYTFDGPFYDGIFGATIRDTFYYLLLNRPLNISSYPHITLIKKDDIMEFIKMLDSCQYSGNNGFRYPNISYRLRCHPIKERFLIAKEAAIVWALIILYYKDEHCEPVLIWQIDNYLNLNGFEFNCHYFDEDSDEYDYKRYFENCKQ